MNIIEHGNPKKVEAEKRRKDIKRFRCQICGALWEASISKKECRIVTQEYNDDRWVSDCPEEYCDGIGEEEEKSSTCCETCKNYESNSDIFNQLYHQRAMLFAALVNQNRDISWKTRKHEDGEPCFGGGWFLVTIDTPEGAYGYHYEDKYWDIFHCKELEKAKHWDGYTEEDVGRLMSLPDTELPPKTNGDRIRKMNNEELADIMQGQCACCAYQLTGCTEKGCKDGAYEWLIKEAEK